jgi:hypothetical protein
VWYAGRGEGPVDPPSTTTLTAPPPKETSTMAVEPPPVKPQIVELRFDSMPRAGVFAEGHAAELCRTPCSFDVNLADGGPQDRRKFIVHADGYKDSAVDVDLASSQRAYSVTLEQFEAHLPPRPTPVGEPTDAPATNKHAKVTKTTHVKKPTDLAKTTDNVPEKPEPVVEEKAPDPVKPVEVKKPDVKKPAGPSGKIDQTETLDRFHRHTP